MMDLFEQLLAGGEAAVKRLVDERFQENVQLEFKSKTKRENGELTKEDRENLGKMVSAFANSSGGVLIWGIIARKNEDGIDCASELAPIEELEKFRGAVERAVSQVVMPRHEAIEIAVVPADQKSGYLLLRVQRSERRPHRCEVGDKQYFKRIGDSTVAMEHYDIEDSFKRFNVPFLDVEISISDAGTSGGPDGTIRRAALNLSLSNPSAVSARYPYLVLKKVKHANPLLYSQLNNPFRGGADDIVHPTLSLKVIELVRQIRVKNVDGKHVIRKGTLEPTIIAYTCGCLNSRPREARIEITEAEFCPALNIDVQEEQNG